MKGECAAPWLLWLGSLVKLTKQVEKLDSFTQKKRTGAWKSAEGGLNPGCLLYQLQHFPCPLGVWRIPSRKGLGYDAEGCHMENQYMAGI